MWELRFVVLQSLMICSALVLKYSQIIIPGYYSIPLLIFLAFASSYGLLTLLLTRSLLLSVLNIASLYSVLFLLSIPMDPLIFSLYVGGTFLGSSIWYVVHRTIPERIDFKRYIITKPRVGLIPIGLAFAVTGYILSGSIYLFLGSVLDSLIAAWIGRVYLAPISSLSWISLPYLLSQNPIRKGRGVCVGNIRRVLKRRRTSLPNTYRYEWIEGEGNLCIDLAERKNYNSVVLGSSGTGKSTLVKKLMTSLGLPFIIFDLHGEYSIPSANTINLSETGVNPLSLFGFSPRDRALEVAIALKSVFNLGHLQTMDFFSLLLEAYQDKGIYEEDQRTWSLPPPTFKDVISLLQKKKKLSIRSDEMSRLEGLETYLRFLDSSVFMRGEVDMDVLIKGSVILDFSGLPSNEIKYIIMITLLNGIMHNMYKLGGSGLRRMIVIDEAPFLVSREAGERIAERFFAEGRKFGYGVVLVSQTKDGIEKAINNSDSLFIFNMRDPRELEYVSKLLGGSHPEAFKAIYEMLMQLNRGELITRDSDTDELLMVSLN